MYRKLYDSNLNWTDRQFLARSVSAISFYPQDGEHGKAVLEHAGTAMYRVKNEGGNSSGFYSSESSVVWTRDQLELAIPRGLATGI